MKIVVFLFTFLTVSAAWANPPRIYFFDGFYVPVPIISEIHAYFAIKSQLEKTHSDAELVVTHSDFWKIVCNDLLELKPEDRPSRLTLIGHSMGVGGAIETSRCLKEKDYPVDLIVSIDGESLGVFKEDDVIPDNVKENYNFYQTLDIFIKGNKNNHRADGTDTGIHNIFVDVPFSFSPHIQIVDELINQNLIFPTLGI